MSRFSRRFLFIVVLLVSFGCAMTAYSQRVLKIKLGSYKDDIGPCEITTSGKLKLKVWPDCSVPARQGRFSAAVIKASGERKFLPGKFLSVKVFPSGKWTPKEIGPFPPIKEGTKVEVIFSRRCKEGEAEKKARGKCFWR